MNIQSKGAAPAAPPTLAERQTLLITLLVLVDSMHFIFARMLLPHISPTVSAMYVMAIGTVQVGIFGLWRGELRWSALRENLPFFLAIGALIGASTYCSYVAVGFVDAGTASMLGKLSIVYSIGFGLFWLRERLNSAQITGAAVAIVGTIIIAYQPGDVAQIGSLIIVGSTFMYALHTALVKRYGGEIEFVNFFFFRLLGTTAALFVIALGASAVGWGELALPRGIAWLLLPLVATVDVVISRIFFYVALRRLQLSLHAIILTLSPVAAVLWSLLLFGEAPNAQQALGGACVLIGVLVAMLNPVRVGRKAAAAK